MTHTTPDLSLDLYLEIQGISGVLMPIGSEFSVSGRDSVRAIRAEDIRIESGRVSGWTGLAEPGGLSLDLLDATGAITGWLTEGAKRSRVEADVASTDTEIIVAKGGGWTVGDAAYLHREAVVVDAVDTTNPAYDVLTVTRNFYGLGYTPWHDVTIPTRDGDTIIPDHVLSSSPEMLEGRLCRLWVRDAGQATFTARWAGRITACPPSTTAAGYQLQAESLEGLLAQEPEVLGLTGVFVADPSFPLVRVGSGWRATIYHSDIWGINVRDLPEGEMTWAEMLQPVNDFLEPTNNAIKAVWSQNLYGEELQAGVLLQRTDALGAAPPDLGAGRMGVAFSCSDAEGRTGIDKNDILQSKHTGLARAVGPHYTGDNAIPTGQMTTFGVESETPEAVNAIRVVEIHEDARTPARAGVVTISSPTDAYADRAGYGKLGDELISWAGSEVKGEHDGQYLIQLNGTERSLNAEQASTTGDQELTLREIFYPASANFYTALAAVLTGTADRATNGTHSEHFGLGIPQDLVNLSTLGKTAAESEIVSPTDETEAVRDWASVGCMFDRRVLISRDGKLTVSEMGRQIATDVPLATELEPWEDVAIHGGIGDIINEVVLDLPRGEAVFRDQDSIARVGLRSINVEYATTNPAIFTPHIHALLQVTGRKVYRASFTLTPAGRFAGPGDIVLATFPNPGLSDSWRVLDATTHLSGRGGAVRISAQTIPAGIVSVWAPSAEVYMTHETTVVTVARAFQFDSDQPLDASWFHAGDEVIAHDPEDFENQVEMVVDGVLGWSIYMTENVPADVQAGWIIRHKDYTTSTTDSKEMYLFVRSDKEWG